MAIEYEFVRRGAKRGIRCLACGCTSWNRRDVERRFCPYCEVSYETKGQRLCREFKEEDRYMNSPHPFPPKRMTLFDKLSSLVWGAMMVFGSIWLLAIIVRSLFR